MADAVVRLKVESQEYENKLARATQQLQHMEKEVRRTGASFEFADKEELAFIQSLGQMETKTQSVRSKMREYTESILSLSEMYERLSDTEKNSDFGRGLLSSIDQIKQRAAELKDNMGDLDEELKNMASDTAFTDGVGLMTSTLGACSAAITAWTSDSKEMEQMIRELAKIATTVEAVNKLTVAFQKQNMVLLKNPYVLAAAGIAAIGVAIAKIVKNARGLTDTQRALNEIQTTANNNAAEEITRIETLNNILHDNTRRLDERKVALSEIQALVPDYHGSLTDEGTLINDNTSALDNYINGLKRAAVAQAAFDKMVEIQKKKLEAELKVQKAQQELDAAIAKRERTLNSVTYAGTEYSPVYANDDVGRKENALAGAKAEVQGYKEQLDEIDKLVKASDITTTNPTTETGEVVAEVKPVLPEGSAAKLKQELADLKNAWDIATTQKERDQLAADIDRVTKKLEKMRGKVVETSDATDTEKVKTAADMWNELSEKIAEAERLLGEFQAMAANTELSEEQRNWAADMVKNYEEEIKNLKNTKEVIPIQFSDKGINELKNKIKEALGGEIFGSDGYALQATKIVDVTTLENLLNTALTNGLNVDMTYLSGLFESIKLDADIDDSTWDALVAEINTQLEALDLPKIKLDVTTGNITNVAKDAAKATDEWQQAVSAVGQLGGALNNLEDPSAKVAGIIMQAVANIALGFAQAAASPATGAAGVFGWIAAATAGVATMASTIASIKSVTKGGFANGGIVPGNSFSGDNLHTSDYGINSGELILNRAQQNTIASQLQGGAAQNMRLEALISGESLRMVLANNASRRGGNRAQYAISKFG